MKNFWHPWAWLTLALALASCGQRAAETAGASGNANLTTLTDGAGRVVKIPAAPQRIVSVSPAATDILLSVGAHAELVGASRYCVIPAADENHVTRIGGVMDPDYERILSLKPDLVVAPFLSDKTLQEKLVSLGLPLVVLHPEGLQGVIDDIRLIGRAAGREAAGETTAKSLEDMRALAASRWNEIPPEKRPRVLVRMDSVSPAPGSYVDDLITAAGGSNVLPRGQRAWVEVSPESVLQLDPDLIIDIRSSDQPTTAMEKVTTTARAKVVTLREGGAFYHPGPGLGRALWELARAIHPALFPESTPPLASTSATSITGAH